MEYQDSTISQERFLTNTTPARLAASELKPSWDSEKNGPIHEVWGVFRVVDLALNQSRQTLEVNI